MLIDRATIFIRSGKGGEGVVSFRREKYVPKGGPDGGDGGRGGDVVLVGDAGLNTLLPLTHRPHYRAGHGGDGAGKSRHGADGADVEIRLPLGTLVYDRETGELVADVSEPGQRVVVLRGGRGGLGNERFKTATNQTPREATPGEPAQEMTLDLRLKLIADVGLIGMPNAGKSTMLRAVSRATPKVADYPFTTLQPHLGIAELPGERRLVIADIPGLIAGAAAGAGLGHDFLSHVERTRVLVHVLDAMPLDGSEPASNYRAIREELAAYEVDLSGRPEIIALNKADLLSAAEREAAVSRLAEAIGVARERIIVTSGAAGEGIADLLEACWRLAGGEQEQRGWSGAGRIAR